MRNIVRKSARLALLVPLAVAPLAVAGCAVTEPTVTTSSSAVNRTVLYPGGRYQLYGDGVSTPYHWVWIPTGGNIVNAPPLPTIPSNTVVTTPVPAGGGQYQLYGNGSTVPFYWVWVPSGATPPPPPLPPRM
jgi:hypothetical protein